MPIHKDQRVGVFVDVQNLYYSAKQFYSAKVKLIEDLILVIAADKTIEKDEITFCREIAKRLDINPDLIDDLLTAYDKL